MNRVINNIIFWIFSGLCILVGLYPIIYFLVDRHFGLLATKNQELLNNLVWNAFFYAHILLGGIALLIGWTQFSPKLRQKRIGVHRLIGKIYVVCVLISGIAGVYIAQFATGGISNVIGFSLSGIVWLSTTFLAYKAVRNGKIELHQKYMIYSYAVCFSAVTLRAWLPILTPITGDFNSAYLIVGWLSWVPNLVVAYFIINRKKRKLQFSN